MKITLMGQPGRIVEKGTIVVTAMKNTNIPTLPKDLPVPSTVSTTYIVYITRKQWQKVNEAMKNPNDALIVDGYPFFDQQLKVMSVLASRTTTKLMESTKRESQRLESE